MEDRHFVQNCTDENASDEMFKPRVNDEVISHQEADIDVIGHNLLMTVISTLAVKVIITIYYYLRKHPIP